MQFFLTANILVLASGRTLKGALNRVVVSFISGCGTKRPSSVAVSHLSGSQHCAWVPAAMVWCPACTLVGMLQGTGAPLVSRAGSWPQW